MHLEFLVEEFSAEFALRLLVPKIVGPAVPFEVRRFQGKPDLIKKLPARLTGYRAAPLSDRRIIVLLDRDQDDCRSLKQQLEVIAAGAQLVTPATAPRGHAPQVINRLAIEELEAWFFGDVPALAAAYPGVSPTLDRQRRFRDPDAIAGGTWEALERVLQRAGYAAAGLSKTESAARIAAHMDPDRNRSRSFRLFRDTLRALTAGGP